MKAFFLGMLEFRQSFTTRCEDGNAYDLGREWAHRLTFRVFENE